jgi:enoyl-CoA hydratase/carnithine racemase
MSILHVEQRELAVVITLNRPEVMNALSSDLATQLYEQISNFGLRKDIRSIVIAGAGERAFSAGTDLKERRGLDPEQKWAQSRTLWRVNMAIWNLPQPVIAAIGGWCLGGGLELALFCDMRVAAEDAVFGFPEMTLGAYPGGGAGVLLPRMVGRAHAKDLFFTARRVGANEAREMGLVDIVVPRKSLLDKALEIANQICSTSPLGVAAVKKLVNFGTDLSFEAAADMDASLRRPLESTRDYQEGINAHFERRKPVFRGE